MLEPWSDNALKLRAFVLEHWCANGRGPAYHDVFDELGLSRRDTVIAYRELHRGLVVVVQDRLQNFPLLKAPPFAAFPTDVECHVDGTFHSHLGCAHEALTVSALPYMSDRDVRVTSRCACCMAPIEIRARGFDLVSVEPATVLIHVSSTPWDWAGRGFESICDSVNFVIDADHGERYERTIARRGVVGTVAQHWQFTEFVRRSRLWDYNEPPIVVTPRAITQSFREVGIDTTLWDDAGGGH